MFEVVVAEFSDLGTGEFGACVNAGVGQLVDKVRACGDHSETESKVRCAKAVVGAAERDTPKKCHSNVCARQNSRRADYDKFTSALKEIASLLRSCVRQYAALGNLRSFSF